MTNVAYINQAVSKVKTHEKRRDLEQVLVFCDAVELVAKHEPDEAKRDEKLARVERTRTSAHEALASLTEDV